MKMFKKLLLVGLLLAGIAFLFVGREAASYVSTTAGWVKDSVKGSVPMEFELERARQMVKDLDPEIRKNMHVIAKEEVEVQRLGEQIQEREGKQDKDRNELMRLRTDLQSGQQIFQYASRRYTADEVRVDMARRLERCKSNDATLESMRKVLKSREAGLEAAKTKLLAMQNSKATLIAKLAEIDARREEVAAAEAANQLSFDDSLLGQVKSLVSDLQTRVEVDAKIANAESNFPVEIELDETAPANIDEEVAQYLNPNGIQVAASAEAIAK